MGRGSLRHFITNHFQFLKNNDGIHHIPTLQLTPPSPGAHNRLARLSFPQKKNPPTVAGAA